ncbi:TFIIB-type zinc ribbon-containing protein [Geotalea uraniireducens]|uniref:Transcription factor zinc-finger domain-containing protein n=1 Tax=Geotalea uraniireducens (strain Rf4) TaxID=351605 RepID=A5G5G0_GEOUR|nr:hypothetical protein [Geotalea uraniireducens]ABQ27028.1 hypothetical protein Gura_2855 [Geotalea uraniireducens Rf4]
MNCPHCKSSNSIEIDMHSDGYAKDILECTSCGAVWINHFGAITLLNKKAA